MKVLNKDILEKILNFIKTYQIEKGESPSFREIMKNFNLSSLSVVNRYINSLCKLGVIDKNSCGKIDISKNFEKGKTIIAPVVGTVACGSPIYAQENIECLYQLPVDIFGNEKQFILHAQGDSMQNIGIQDGDLLVIKKCDTADNGNIVVALLDDSATVKRFFKKNGKIILHPENEKYDDIIVDDVMILGIVQHCIHKF